MSTNLKKRRGRGRPIKRPRPRVISPVKPTL